MNKFEVQYTPKAVKQLKKLDPSTRRLIFAWIDKNLSGCSNPRVHGKGLTGNHSREWRYRVGNYRIIVDIQDSEVIILVLEVGHRRDIYK